MSATLLTLAPIPDAFRSLQLQRSGRSFLSWGCPKIAPPSYVRRGVRLPGAGAGACPLRPCFPFGMGMPVPIRVPSSWFLTTSTASSSTTPRPSCRPLPILGFTTFPPVAKQGSPRCGLCPSKLSLRRQRRGHGEVSAPAVRVTGSIVSDRPFTASLASSPFLFPRVRRSRAGERGSRGLEALLHRRVRCRSDRFRSNLPGAPLGLSDSDPAVPPPAPRAASGVWMRSGPRSGSYGDTSKTTPRSGSSVSTISSTGRLPSVVRGSTRFDYRPVW
jgi:hypothetical protein